MTEPTNELIQKIISRQAIIGVIGLGYVGLPLVKAFLLKGFRVVGFDVDHKKVEQLKRGESYIQYFPGEELKPFLMKGSFRPTTDFQLLKEVDVIIICVPTPLDAHRNPDLSYVLNTTRTIATYLRSGQLIILESTTYPGTTEEEMKPILEETGLMVGQDFFLAYSPERENPGDVRFTTEKIPKVVGGVTEACLQVAKTLYDQIVVQTIPVSSCRVAEATKLLENIFRSVNIALVNELKMIFERLGIDVWEVIEAASTKPFGYMPFYPGPGYGGHCIPVDPFYLTWKAKEVDYSTKFIELAGEINTQMPYYVVAKTVEALNERGKSIKGARILILGVAYKKDVDDQRESPALKIIQILRQKGAEVSYNDPYVPHCFGHRDYPDLDLWSEELSEEVLKKMDAVIIATDHSVYDFAWIVAHSPLIIDTRNAVKGVFDHVVKA
ncbi:nucleotide sugar dehydrogenase [Candidatus Aminicenantes bacterium AC-334-K16]|nr:nucleotide sugar dehydrogenase [Candidatus Aminicenantes bacterium AC-334-K16]